MSKETIQEGSSKEEMKEFLKKWGYRLGLVAIGLLGLSLLIA